MESIVHCHIRLGDLPKKKEVEEQKRQYPYHNRKVGYRKIANRKPF